MDAGMAMEPSDVKPKKIRKVRKKRAQLDTVDQCEAQAVGLDLLLSKQRELEEKLDSWMRHQEELILAIDCKIFGPGDSSSSLGLDTVPEVEEVPRSFSAVVKVLEKNSSAVSEGSSLWSVKKIKNAVSSIARKAKEPQKSRSKLRNSREVQDFYVQQRIREMKRTRRNPEGPPETFRDRCADLVTHPIFEMSMMFFCLLNAVMVGIEVNWFAFNLTATSPPIALTVTNHIMTVIFASELAMKAYVLQFRFFKVDVGWHALDTLVVSTGLAELVIDLVNALRTCNAGSDCSDSGVDLSILRALRIARAVRLARLARLVQYIFELRRLIISVAATLKSVFWTLVLLALIIYTFAVIFQQAVNDHEQALIQRNIVSDSTMDKFFLGLMRTGMTLLQTATGGVSWIEVESTISNISWLMVLLFLCYFSFIYFAVLNVVTGVFCSAAIESASQDAEAQIDEHLRKSKDYSERLLALFDQIDVHKTGSIGILEFEEQWDDPGLQALLSTLGINQAKAWKLFEIMDEDDNGEINADEFVSTCFKLQGAAQRVDTERIYAGLKRLGAAVEDLGGLLGDVLNGIDALKIAAERRQFLPRAPFRSDTSPLRKATTMT